MNKETYKQYYSFVRQYGYKKGVVLCPIYLDPAEVQQLYVLFRAGEDTFKRREGRNLKEFLFCELTFKTSRKWV